MVWLGLFGSGCLGLLCLALLAWFGLPGLFAQFGLVWILNLKYFSHFGSLWSLIGHLLLFCIFIGPVWILWPGLRLIPMAWTLMDRYGLDSSGFPWVGPYGLDPIGTPMAWALGEPSDSVWGPRAGMCVLIWTYVCSFVLHRWYVNGLLWLALLCGDFAWVCISLEFVALFSLGHAYFFS